MAGEELIACPAPAPGEAVGTAQGGEIEAVMLEIRCDEPTAPNPPVIQFRANLIPIFAKTADRALPLCRDACGVEPPPGK